MTRKRKKRSPLIPAWVASFIILWNDLRKTILLGSASLLWRGLTRFWRVWTVAAVSLLVGAYAHSAEVGWVLFATMLTGLAYLRLRRPRAGSRWWDHDTLSTALVDAGVLRMSGDALPSLSYRGKPQHSEHGTSVTVGLPQAKTLDDFVGKPRKRVASALMVPENRLTITQEPDDNANVVRIHVGAAKRKGSAAPPVATADRTDWSVPIRLGVDDRGREVTFATTETHTVMAGATGSGKSVLAHLVVAHAALDPRVRLYGIDGKGDAGAKGWQPLEPVCAAFVRGMGADSPARIEALLTEVYELSEQRGADGDEAPEIVLILEEWAAARTVMRRLNAAAADRCDALVTVLLATARSRGVHILVIAQRGTATSFPVDQRANCGQRLVGKFGDRAEAGYVLESLPSRLPERAGEFAVSLDGKAPTLVTADYLTNEAWVKVCKRAARLRAGGGGSGERPALTVVRAEPSAGEPLADAVTDVLRPTPQGMSAAQLHALLPDWVRDVHPTATSLGIALGRLPEVRRAYLGSARVWRLTNASRTDSSAGVP